MIVIVHRGVHPFFENTGGSRLRSRRTAYRCTDDTHDCRLMQTAHEVWRPLRGGGLACGAGRRCARCKEFGNGHSAPNGCEDCRVTRRRSAISRRAIRSPPEKFHALAARDVREVLEIRPGSLGIGRGIATVTRRNLVCDGVVIDPQCSGLTPFSASLNPVSMPATAPPVQYSESNSRHGRPGSVTGVNCGGPPTAAGLLRVAPSASVVPLPSICPHSQ